MGLGNQAQGAFTAPLASDSRASASDCRVGDHPRGPPPGTPGNMTVDYGSGETGGCRSAPIRLWGLGLGLQSGTCSGTPGGIAELGGPLTSPTELLTGDSQGPLLRGPPGRTQKWLCPPPYWLVWHMLRDPWRYCRTRGTL